MTDLEYEIYRREKEQGVHEIPDEYFDDKEMCPYEKIVIQYFGLPAVIEENDTIVTDFGQLVNLVCMAHQKLIQP